MANVLKTEKKVAIISMLCEGASIRAVERITGVHGDTIGRLALRVGMACKAIMDEKMRGLTCQQIEVDEIWGFIGAKQKNARRAGAYGDVWTFIALDADTKLIPSFTVGKRDAYHAKAFISDLSSRVKNRVQISSDGLKAYEDAIERGFGTEVDYGQIVKTYSVIPALLTPAERSFFGVLQQALMSDYQIFAKVRLADIVRPARSPSRSGWQSAFNRITGKHVDFVLCDSECLGVVAVVELDDRSHERFERGVRDSLVDTALADAGIPVLRVSARQTYSPPRIREQVQNLFRSREKAAKIN